MNDKMNSNNIKRWQLIVSLFFFFFLSSSFLPANEREDMRMGEHGEWESVKAGVDRSRVGPVRVHWSIIFIFLALLLFDRRQLVNKPPLDQCVSVPSLLSNQWERPRMNGNQEKQK